jgi:uncharacterized membrane protein YccC
MSLKPPRLRMRRRHSGMADLWNTFSVVLLYKSRSSRHVSLIYRNFLVFVFHLDQSIFVMSFKDLKEKRDSRRVTTVTASLAQPSETQPQDQSPKGYDGLQAAWTPYEALPSNTKIQETVERGRGLWATEPISAGDVQGIELASCI